MGVLLLLLLLRLLRRRCCHVAVVVAVVRAVAGKVAGLVACIADLLMVLIEGRRCGTGQRHSATATATTTIGAVPSEVARLTAGVAGGTAHNGAGRTVACVVADTATAATLHCSNDVHMMEIVFCGFFFPLFDLIVLYASRGNRALSIKIGKIEMQLSGCSSLSFLQSQAPSPPNTVTAPRDGEKHYRPVHAQQKCQKNPTAKKRERSSRFTSFLTFDFSYVMFFV